MDRFDPEMRARVVRIVIALLAAVAVSVLIGISVGRPFSPPGSSAGPAAATASASAEPTASATPRPSATPAPSPTGPPATAVPEDGWLIRSKESFEQVSTWPAQQEASWASGYADGRYWLKLDGQRTISYRVPLDAAEFRITVDVQVSGGYAGLLFLADDSSGVYRFLIDAQGRYRLERQRGAEATALRDWTAASAIRPGDDAVNQIEVRRVEDEISLYANDARLATFPLPAGASLQAQVGMTLDALARDRVAQAYFDNLIVRVPVVPAGS